ncbi:DMT family transporter [uncultured Pontibacter sp.]|uniref:DMT family transporter n=1 Tax=uncultured Pontibacter sp. TaxID=453356 RepID=UPI002603000B|nr:DMT family transporter [uncultured Pontibacter sp.]
MPQANLNWILLLPILAGVAVAIQTALNGQLRVLVNSPLIAALLSFMIGTLALVLLVIFTKQQMPGLSHLSGTDWYKFVGGLLGAFFIVVMIVSVQRMSVANLLALVVAGQLITALILDHFGLLGAKQSSITLTRALGAIALIIGTYLINKK